jgi:hypothetical protein
MPNTHWEIIGDVSSDLGFVKKKIIMGASEDTEGKKPT